MMMIRILLAGAGLAVAASAASAATTTLLASAPIFGGPKAASYTCYFSNYSAQPIVLTNPAVTEDPGTTTLPLTHNNCATLGAGRGASCQFEAAVPQPPSAAYACSIQAEASSATVASMRVTILVQDASGNVLYNEAGH